MTAPSGTSYAANAPACYPSDVDDATWAIIAPTLDAGHGARASLEADLGRWALPGADRPDGSGGIGPDRGSRHTGQGPEGISGPAAPRGHRAQPRLDGALPPHRLYGQFPSDCYTKAKERVKDWRTGDERARETTDGLFARNRSRSGGDCR